MPNEFVLLFMYVKSLQFEDRPDYKSMIDMLETAKSKLTYSQSMFDWALYATDGTQYRKLKNAKVEVLNAYEHARGKLTKEE